MPVFLKRKPAIFWGFGGKAPNGVFASFCRRGQKDVAAHSTPLSAGFRTLCADIPKSRFSFRLCREAPPFFPQRKGGKKCQGVNPLEPRVAGRLSFQESRREGGYPNPPIYKKGPAAPGFGLLQFFSPAPNRSTGASGPLSVWASVQEKTVMPVFLKRKPDNFLGVRGGETPGSPFAFFWGSGQKKVAAHSTPLSAGFRTLCADILKSRFSFRLCREAPPFFPQRKGGKKRQGALPPEPPGSLPAFFLGKPAGGWIPKPTHIQKRGCGPL